MALLDSIFSIQIVQGTVSFLQRKKLEFAGAGVTVEDDPVLERTRVTITGGGGGGDLTEIESDIADLQDDMVVVQTMAAAHKERHIRGGADELQTDLIRALFVPVNYVRTLVGGLTTHAEQLGSHLKGIDDALRNLVRINYVTEAGTAHTFVLTDAYKTLLCTNAAAIGIQIPTNATVAYEVGTVFAFAALGTGQVTITGAGGVTVISSGNEFKSARQNAVIFAQQTAANTWLVTGEKAA